MFPSIKQSVTSIYKTLEEVVIPELTDKAFANEQATMISAQLRQIADVVESQHQYLRIELEDTLKLLRNFSNDTNMAILELPVYKRVKTRPIDELQKMMYVEMQELLLELKAELNQLIEKHTLNQNGEIHTGVQHYIDRKLDRENSWFRLSGFIENVDQTPSINDILKKQSE